MEPRVRVVLYTKPGCGLCEVMKAEISKAGIGLLLQPNISKTMEIIDTDN